MDVQDWDVDFCVFSFYKVPQFQLSSALYRHHQLLYRYMGRTFLPSTSGLQLSSL
jgi:selenocysteine lyase/cysteine desulfurase